jgi:asparagine synthase (glutamine-hydrolysing)
VCGIAAAIDLGLRPRGLLPVVETMSELIAHRGPDGHGLWERERGGVAFGHRRLTIIDLTTGEQPMTDGDGAWVTYNGEIYNYVEVREVLGERAFRTTSDTEVLLRAYRRWGVDCLAQLRGMFAFALWDESEQTLFCARDRFGIKPLYYAQVDGMLVLASEAKALLPFLPSIETDPEGLQDYLTFQFVLHGKTLFRGVQELLPGHYLLVRDGQVTVRRYWEVQYEPDFDHTERYFSDRLDELVQDSVRLHLRADVPVGSYVSGGLDSSIVAGLASQQTGYPFQGFTGRFDVGPEFDESRYARDLAVASDFDLHEVTITPEDVRTILPDLIYHLDFPVAGPGSIPQYMVSKLAAQHVKVVLGGQGGDEIFGGYARYLIAYFEQCIKAAIEGTMRDGNFVVTYESIIPSLSTLREYKPLLREFWREGLFEDLDRRYYRLVDRAPQLAGAIDPGVFGDESPFARFHRIFRADNVQKESYFDSMTHFDFKTLLPALLQIEDRVSMAHGLESRVPFVDHAVVDFAATMPADVKFKNGQLKHVLRQSLDRVLPRSIAERTDKMGFPVPLRQWVGPGGPLRDFAGDVLGSAAARSRPYLADGFDPVSLIDSDTAYGRSLWGLLSLELWQARFHDRSQEWQALRQGPTTPYAASR